MKKLIVALITFTFAVAVSAQTTQTEMQDKIKQLEAQIQLIQAELAKLKTPVTKPAEPVATATEKKAEPEKKPAGFEVANGVRVIPYGTIYFNMYGNDGGTNNTDIPLFATNGKGNLSGSARQTRLGLKIEGGKVGNAKLSAILETDFYGGSPAIPIGENFGVLRMRLANAKLDWKDTSVTIGQDWMVFAPQSPFSIADAALPQFGAAGNLWARIPQVKIEQRAAGGKLVLQGAVLAGQTGDSSTVASFLMAPNSGALSRVPFVQGRAAYASKNFAATKKAGTIGVSGHFGRSRTTSTTAPIAEEDIDSYGVAVDWNLPLHKRIVWSGEGFTGQNLGGFQGGVFQSYNTDYAVRSGATLTPRGVKGIRSSGGWTQVGVTPKTPGDKLVFYGSVGIDDPKNLDLVNTRSRDFRARNFQWATDAIYKLSPQLQVGIEFRHLETRNLLTGKKRANHVNLGAAYSF